MSGQSFKDVMKSGWHPKGKDGKGESWRSDFKGVNQVAGWMGKGKDPNQASREHVSAPLSSLKDPASFAPPPKHVQYYGSAAAPNRTTSSPGGLGSPLNSEQLRQQQLEAQQAEEEANKPKPPPVPYRVNTTGLSTQHLPPPPKRTDGADGRTPSPGTNPGPRLPPRLPPRQNSSPAAAPALPPPPSYSEASSEPPAHKGILNQGAVGRLGAAGVAVPGLGIGAKSPPSLPSRSSTTSPSSTSSWQKGLAQVSLSSPSPNAETPSEGTSFAQKQAAFRTAAAFKKDPSSVSLADARSAASTANNFRQRHGDQVAAGMKSANDLNNKYRLSDKVGAFAPPPPPVRSPEPTTTPSLPFTGEHTTAFKKKPPPPPKKKAALQALPSPGPPPPIPYASKPPPTDYSPPNNALINDDLDLDLGSLWFAQNPPQFPPPSFKKYPDLGNFTRTGGWGSNGVRKIYTLTAAMRDMSDLSIRIIHLTWDESNPGHTVKAQQKHLPAPRPPTSSELEDYKQKYSEHIASWCERQIGTKVGDGECWTLANEALKAVVLESTRRNIEPCMTSQSYSHGALLYHYNMPSVPEPQGGIRACGVSRGDIAQFTTARFEARDGRSWSTAGAPNHTAVIIGIERDGRVKVLEQNTGGVKIVKESFYDFSTLVKGDVKIFRATPESWAGKLVPRWE